MRHFFTGISLAMFTWMGSSLYSQEPPDIGQTFPDFLARDVDGKTVNPRQWLGRVVILTIKDIDSNDDKQLKLRQRILDFYRSRQNKGLEIVRIVCKKNLPFFISRAFVEKKAATSNQRFKENYTIIVDWDLALKKLLGFYDTPIVFLIDRKGTLRWMKKGTLDIDMELDSRVRQLIGESR